MAENKSLNSEASTDKEIQETKNDVFKFLVTSDFLNEFMCPNGKKNRLNQECETSGTCGLSETKCCENETKCGLSETKCCENETKCGENETNCCENDAVFEKKKSEKESTCCEKKCLTADRTIEKILKFSGFFTIWQNLCKESDVRGLAYMNLFLRDLVNSKLKGKGPSYLDSFSTEELSGALEQLDTISSHFDLLNEKNAEDVSENDSGEDETDDENDEDDDEDENDEDEEDEENDDEDDENDEDDEEDDEDDEEDDEDDDENDDDDDSSTNRSNCDDVEVVYEEEEDEDNICDTVSRKIVNSPTVHLVALLSWFYVALASQR